MSHFLSCARTLVHANCGSDVACVGTRQHRQSTAGARAPQHCTARSNAFSVQVALAQFQVLLKIMYMSMHAGSRVRR
eukprot:46045-Rhodomonas_salina.3